MDGGRKIRDDYVWCWLGRDGDERCRDKGQVERGRGKGRGDRDNGKGKLGPRREGRVNRQTES